MTSGSGTALGRIIAAYEVGVVKLRGFDALSAELLRPDTELALCVVLAVFAGVAVPGLGSVAEAIGALKPSLNLGAAGRQLDRAVNEAAAAKPGIEIARAADALAQAMQALGPERIGPLIGSSQFSQLRGYLAPMRADLLAEVPSEGEPNRSKAADNPAVTARNASAAWWGLGLVGGVGLALLLVGSAPKRKMTYGHG